MAISAREIVGSVKGMCNRPEYYSARGATLSDLNGNRLYDIYLKIEQELGMRQANAFVTMVEKLKTLSATNFLNALYTLEQNDWNLTEFDESNMDLGSDGMSRDTIALATVSESSCHSRKDDTEYIRLPFLKTIDLNRRLRKYRDDYEQ